MGKNMKIFKTKRVIFRIEENKDGTLNVFREYTSAKKMDYWQRDGRPFLGAGLLINQQGGIEGLLAKCEVIDNVDEWVSNLNTEKKAIRDAANAQRMQQTRQEAAKAKEAFEAAFSQDVTESTPDNIYILLRYLNTVNWGVWRLPKMTIGYACHQHDCEGRTATTIKLDKPINYWDKPETMFVYGNPRGYLEKYSKIG